MLLRIGKKEMKEMMSIYDNMEIGKAIENSVKEFLDKEDEKSKHKEELLTELGALRAQRDMTLDTIKAIKKLMVDQECWGKSEPVFQYEIMDLLKSIEMNLNRTEDIKFGDEK